MRASHFSGKVIYITGASAGIGLEMARQLADTGARVAMFARRIEPMAALASEWNAKLGRQALFAFGCDVTDQQALKHAFASALATVGSCDILIANAGGGYPVRARKFDAKAAAAMYELNVFGVLYALEEVLPQMIQRGSGHIVGVSSLASFRAFPESHTYCATKSALSAHLQGLRPELLPYGIDVTTLCPGFIRTDLTAANTVPMPMLMDCDVAVKKMLAAIAAKKKRLAFPWPMYWFTVCSKWIPDRVIAKMTHGKSYKGERATLDQ